MIKRNILALVIPALIAGVSTVNAVEIYNKDDNKLDLYGAIDVLHVFSEENDSDDSHVLLGIKGDTQISNKLAGFGHFEWGTKTNKSEDENENVNHLAYVGLKFADFNSLNYGRNYGVLYNVNAWTNVLPIYSANTMSNADSYLTNSNRNLLTYNNTDLFGLVDGLNLTLQFQGKNTENNISGSNDALKNNGSSLGFASHYDTGWGVTMSTGYVISYRDQIVQPKTIDSKVVNTDNATGWNTSIKYDANNVYLAAMYGETSNMTGFGRNKDTPRSDKLTEVANKTENLEVVGQYLFDTISLKPSIAYVQSKAQYLPDVSYNKDKQDLMKYVSLGAFYYFNDNLTAVVDYKFNLINSNRFADKYNIDIDNMIGLGVVYQF